MDLCAIGREMKEKEAVRQGWKPPQVSFMKINVDAMFSDAEKQGGTGLGVRDHHGKLIIAQAR